MSKGKRTLHNFFKNSENFISAVFGILITAATLLFKNVKIPMWILGIAVILIILIIWYYEFKLASLEDTPQNIIPICWHRHRDYGDILIIDSYNFLHTNAYVTIYVDDEIEEYFATGMILCEQTSAGKLMVRILKPSAHYINNHPKEFCPATDKLRIKPILTDHFFKEK